MNTVKLFIERVPDPRPFQAPGSRQEVLTEFAPFMRGRLGGYVHRVRSGAKYFYDGQHTHTAVHFWCGGTSFPFSEKREKKYTKQPEIFDTLPAGATMCATCEGRAIGAGFAGQSRMHNGVMLKFSPRA